MNNKIRVSITTLFLIMFLSFSALALDTDDDKFYIATKAYSDGFYEAAISLFNRFVEEFPKSKHFADANLYIGKCYFQTGKYQRTETVLKEVMATVDDASKDEFFYWLAKVSLKAKKYDDALGYANKVFDNYKNSKFFWETKFVAARVYAEEGEWQKSETLFQSIINGSSGKVIEEKAFSFLLNHYFRQNKYDKIKELSGKYIHKYPKGNFIPRAYFYLGKAQAAQNNYDAAIKNYEKGLAAAVDTYISDLIRQGISLAYLEKGDASRAAKYLDQISDSELKAFSMAIFHFNEKEYIKALKDFDNFLSKFSDSEYVYKIYINKAETFYELGRINDALSTYQLVLTRYVKAGATDPAILDKAHYGLAWCYLKNGEYRRAIEEFRLTLRYTNNPIVKISAEVQIADTYQQEKKYDLALSMYSDILLKNPDNIYSDYVQFQIARIFLQQDRLSDAALALRALERNYPKSTLIPEVRYYLAIGYFSSGDYVNAELLLNDFGSRFPGHYLNEKAEYLSAKCFFNRGEYAKSLDKFNAIIDKYKNSEITELIKIDIGNVYLNMDKMKAAEEAWRNFLKEFPDSSYADSVKLYLGGMYETKLDYPSALEYYKQVANNVESLLVDEALFSLGHLYFIQNDIEKAKYYFNVLANKNNDYSLKAKIYLIKLYTNLNDDKKALKICDEILRQDKAYGAAYFEKGKIFKKMNKLNKAIDAFRAAIANGVSSGEARFLLAGVLHKAKKYTAAIDEYLKVIYKLKDSRYYIKSYFQIAKIYTKQGNMLAAKEIYEKIESLKVPESKIARMRMKELNLN